MVKRKLNVPPVKGKALIWGAVAVTVVFVCLFLAVLGLVSFLRHSQLFVVREIAVVSGLGAVDIPEFGKLKGQNIFSVDLAQVEEKIRSKYPRIGGIGITRRFPDQLSLVGFVREPVAVAVVGGRSIVVSRDGYLIGPLSSDLQGLPVIQGLKPAKVAVGMPLGDERWGFVLDLIAQVGRTVSVAELPFRSADINDATRIICIFGEGKGKLEAYFDKDRFTSQLKTLSGMLLRSDLDFAEIKYIDLRFGEPLIGKKKARK